MKDVWLSFEPTGLARFAASEDWSRTLFPGTVYAVEGTAVLDASSPSLTVVVNGAECDYPVGQFQILKIDTFSDGGLREFAATFEQHCGVYAATGCVHFAQ
ncbi:MAG TPA: hypothetical protein VGI39_24825 [Polyangiaceae bacterium]